ncbi:MAG: CBS domain-containing protein [Oligoflexus sp.]
MENLRVRDLMSENLITINADRSLADAYDLLDEFQIRHLLVIDTNLEDGGLELIGLLTHRDLAMRALYLVERRPYSEGQDILRQKTVGEIMTHNPETIDPDAPLLEAADEMLSNKFGCLPVVEGKQLVGILTESDFIKYVVELITETDQAKINNEVKHSQPDQIS